MSEPLAAQTYPDGGAPGAAALAERIVTNLGSAVHASPETLRLPLLCLLAEGHVLVEDVPGVGKTVLAKALARSLELSFHRVQFTPDLLPADVTGVNVFDRQSGACRFGVPQPPTDAIKDRRLWWNSSPSRRFAAPPW